MKGNQKPEKARLRRLTNAHADAFGGATLIRTGGVSDALNRLKAYEDTGFSPEELSGCIRKCSTQKGAIETDRLTERTDGGGITVKDLPAALKKLAELEDAEEEKRIIPLPCKPGDTVYTLASQNGPVLEWTVRDVTVYPDEDVIFYILPVGGVDDLNYFVREDIGHTLFFSLAEAESALKKRG